ncbi:MAG: hypothetical protein ACK4ND_16395 [Cytophagaceae bacterium]
MDLRKIFGPVLTLIGSAGLIYAGFIFIDTNMDRWISALVVFIIASIFFSSGIGLIKESSTDKRD